ncbi:multicomponent Na+:H+ antiporter subunit D [Desulfitispora alkaliphila]|uniref:Na+/H+ antiporter subunit D n=1 Tax=Desulfitispora alkaliphila TaxID=622674 RepID=UPI003D1A9170
MSNNLAVLPVLLPLATAIILMFFKDNVKIQRWLSGLAALAGVALSFYLFNIVATEGIQVYTGGNWKAPFGIVLVADLLSMIMVVASSIVAAVVVFHSFNTIDEDRERHYYYPFVKLLMVGVYGSFLTGDIFNLFVFFEIMLLASYVLVVLGGEKAQLREAVKYVVINMVSSAFFIVGVALLYSVTGTLNMADLAVKVPQVEAQGLITAIALVFFVVFATKSALVPLYFWLPGTYTAPPIAVAALFGGLLTKVGIYVMIRVYTLIFTGDVAVIHEVILIVGTLTMLIGVLGAITRYDITSILSIHIVSQVGYMAFGIGLFSTLSIAAAIFFTIHNIIVKSCLFLIGGITKEITGTTSLKKMGGLLKQYPVVAWMFFIAGLALAGVPPLSGFFGKYALILAGLESGRYVLVGISVFVSIWTLFSMMKIFMNVYWGEEEGMPEKKVAIGRLLPPALVLVFLSIYMGVNAEMILGYTMTSAEQLMNPEYYINAVLSEGVM